ncbi:hypothetical protein I350_05951 [Cryptococcus amylolentus CBS 6273]|uniref:Bms1-type G domain-containing protein n=1 Tax=Cryptococcus amylolentus CBS 6273 TaxID=1296118 RepID=A0A1E3JR21_9TREE|nr:hypothetical protein I350_05951 [Cryptococcus amylolentus CBS 6273]
MSDHRHRPTLKQSNKGFKSKHASKGSIKAASKAGKPASSAHPHNSSKHATTSSKQARLNSNAQKRSFKHKATAQDLKFFSTASNGGHAPRVVTVVPLLPSLSPKCFLEKLLPCLGLSEDEVQHARTGIPEQGTFVVRAPRFKTTLQVNLLPSLSLYPTLDSALVSDYVVLLLSSVDEVQVEGETVLRCLQGQIGTREVISCVQAPASNPITRDTKQLIHKSLLSFSQYFFPKVAKIHSSDNSEESALLARALCESAPKGATRVDGRPYLIAESAQAIGWVPNDDISEDGESVGQLSVFGTVRGGGTLSADRLVHIPGHGDYQLLSIHDAPLPSRASHDDRFTISQNVLSSPSADADDLVSTNTPDISGNEQTWPTEEEMAGSADYDMNAPSGAPIAVKRVPKGTSSYQAAWIVDDGEGMAEGSEEEMEDLEASEDKREPHRDLDPEQEEQEYNMFIQRKADADQDYSSFPDEVDTPRHITARSRFQRYRGLKSFRTSPWDPYEDLPLDYGRIFQFEDYNATRKQALEECAHDGVETGTRVLLTIKDVPRSIIESPLPVIVHGLLRHEHKQSVLHFVVQRNTEYTDPVQAKDDFQLCLGPRRYLVNPLFSQHSGSKGVNNVHKSEKFMKPGIATVMSIFGPIWFGQSGCLLLKDDGSTDVPNLVATGTFMSSDPTRVIAKRVILTGHPVKVHKKTATIRYMFFNQEDVEYFKSVELHTKYGRTGHIKESLGTHGYYKAHFDGPIQQMDTICMNLYKRQYPKWSTEMRSAVSTELNL